MRVYQWLLGACPSDFRQAYGKEMMQVFRQCCLDAYRQRGRRGVLRLWLPTLIDLLVGVIAEYRRAFALALTAFTRRSSVNQLNRLRSTERTVFWCFIGFVMGYIGFWMMGYHGGLNSEQVFTITLGDSLCQFNNPCQSPEIIGAI